MKNIHICRILLLYNNVLLTSLGDSVTLVTARRPLATKYKQASYNKSAQNSIEQTVNKSTALLECFIQYPIYVYTITGTAVTRRLVLFRSTASLIEVIRASETALFVLYI